jgi:hypothetical protein
MNENERFSIENFSIEFHLELNFMVQNYLHRKVVDIFMYLMRVFVAKQVSFVRKLR